MRQTRIYQPGCYVEGQTITLSSSASQHVGVVLRRRVLDSLILFSGDNVEARATIVSIERKKVEVMIESVKTISRESPLRIHLAQGLSKGDRMDWVVQKAVELGVVSMTPVITQHSVVRLDAERSVKKQAHWEAIAVGACEQSGRNQCLQFSPCCAFSDFLKRPLQGMGLLLDPEATMTLREAWLPNTAVTLLIGPEGGFHEDELVQAREAGYVGVRFGPRVLRTETAAIAAISVLQALQGDL